MSADEPVNLARRSALKLTGAALALPLIPESAQAAGIAPEAPAPPRNGSASSGEAALNVRSFGARGDASERGGTGSDDTAAIQAALDAVRTNGGNVVQFPAGTYRFSAPLEVHPRTILRGAGRGASRLISDHAGGSAANGADALRSGSGLVTASPLNSSTAAYVVLEDLTVANSNARNGGAAFYDTCSTFIACTNVGFAGFRYGVVLDQSELVDFDLCEFAGQNSGGAGLWIVNGNSLAPAARPGFSNRISVKRSQFNQGARAIGIIDDGGYAHVYEDNNYNGCLHHIRAAGVVSLEIRGGEFEGAAGHCILLSSLNRAGASVGGSLTAIRGGSYAATRGSACIFGEGAPGMLHVDGTAFSGGGGAHPISGSASFAALCLLSYTNNAPVAVKDGSAGFATLDLLGSDPEISTRSLALSNAGLVLGGKRVVGPQHHAIRNDVSGAANQATVNAILDALRAHGLIAS
jgi:hypothetical protein